MTVPSNTSSPMPWPSTRVDASIAFCRQLARQAHSNFAPCAYLLPGPKRSAMTVLYAFMRHTDDLADNDQPLESRREALARWRRQLAAAFTGPAGLSEGVAGTAGAGQRLLPALVATTRRFQIPRCHLDAVIDGVEMDLHRTGYETFDELAEYCHRVASAVGLACLHIWGFRGEGVVDLARQCGLAFQLTNILRDLKEDAAAGRIYLPQEDLRCFQYSPEDLAKGVADERFHRLMAFQIDRARRLYHHGADLIDHLERDGKRVFGLMMAIYHGILERIGRCPAAVFRGRLRLGRLRKLAIAARWTLLPARRASLP